MNLVSSFYVPVLNPAGSSLTIYFYSGLYPIQYDLGGIPEVTPEEARVGGMRKNEALKIISKMFGKGKILPKGSKKFVIIPI